MRRKKMLVIFSLYSRHGLQDSQRDDGEDQDVGDDKYQLWRWTQLKRLEVSGRWRWIQFPGSTKFFLKLFSPAFLISPPCWIIMKANTLIRVATWNTGFEESLKKVNVFHLKAISHHVGVSQRLPIQPVHEKVVEGRPETELHSAAFSFSAWNRSPQTWPEGGGAWQTFAWRKCPAKKEWKHETAKKEAWPGQMFSTSLRAALQ